MGSVCVACVLEGLKLIKGKGNSQNCERVNMEELDNVEGEECELDTVPVPKVVKETLKILTAKSSQVLGRGNIPKEAREYTMNHERRGRAIVFNQINFSLDSKRNGAETDVKNLTHTLEALGFAVEIYVDKQSDEIESILKDVQKDDHSNADCILVVMMTHGDEEGFLYDSRGWKFLPSKLWAPFTADLCPSLAGKPKLFLFQACQGNPLDGVVKMSGKNKKFSSYDLPIHADFLVATSTISGKASLRNTVTGSYFITAVCKVLEEEAAAEDLLSMLTAAVRRVATEKPQVPFICSLLTRKVFFLPLQDGSSQ